MMFGQFFSTLKLFSCSTSYIAFATVSTLEAAYNKKKGSLSGALSEQHLVDCDPLNLGCDGGWPSDGREENSIQ